MTVTLEPRTTQTMPAQRTIVRVPETEQHTLVVKQGTRMVCLRFTEDIAGKDLVAYCEGQLGWRGLKDLNVSVDCKRIEAQDFAHSVLHPNAERIDFGSRGKQETSVAEFTRRAPSKG